MKETASSMPLQDLPRGYRCNVNLLLREELMSAIYVHSQTGVLREEVILAVSVQSQNGSSSKGKGAAESGPENVQSARKWIAEWRSGQKQRGPLRAEKEVQNV